MDPAARSAGDRSDAILAGKKIGFGVPVDSWMRGPLAAYLRSVVLDRAILESGLFDQSAVEHAIQQHVAGRRTMVTAVPRSEPVLVVPFLLAVPTGPA